MTSGSGTLELFFLLNLDFLSSGSEVCPQPVVLQQRLVGDLPRIPEGRVPPSADLSLLVIFSRCRASLLVSGRMEVTSGLSGV